MEISNNLNDPYIQIAQRRIEELSLFSPIQNPPLDVDLELAESIRTLDRRLYSVLLTNLNKGLIGITKTDPCEDSFFARKTFSINPSSRAKTSFLLSVIGRYQREAPTEALSLSLSLPSEHQQKTIHIETALQRLLMAFVPNIQDCDLIKEGINTLPEGPDKTAFFENYLKLLNNNRYHFKALSEAEALPIDNPDRASLIEMCYKKLSNYIEQDLIQKNLFEEALPKVKILPKDLPNREELIYSFISRSMEEKKYELTLELLFTIEEEYPDFSHYKLTCIESLVSKNAFEEALEALCKTPDDSLKNSHLIKTCIEHLIQSHSYSKAAQGINLLQKDPDFERLKKHWKNNLLIWTERKTFTVKELNEIPPNFCCDEVQKIYYSRLKKAEDSFQVFLERIRNYPEDPQMISVGLNALLEKGCALEAYQATHHLPPSFPDREIIILVCINACINQNDLDNNIKKLSIFLKENPNYDKTTIYDYTNILSSLRFYASIFKQINSEKYVSNYEDVKDHYYDLFCVYIADQLKEENLPEIFSKLLYIMENFHPITCPLEAKAYFYCLETITKQFPDIQKDLSNAQLLELNTKMQSLFESCEELELLEKTLELLKKHNYPEESWENLQKIKETTTLTDPNTASL